MHSSEQLPFIKRIAYFSKGNVFIWAAAFRLDNCLLFLKKCIHLSSCLSLRELLTFLKEMHSSEQLPFINRVAYFSEGNVFIWALLFQSQLLIRAHVHPSQDRYDVAIEKTVLRHQLEARVVRLSHVQEGAPDFVACSTFLHFHNEIIPLSNRRPLRIP